MTPDELQKWAAASVVAVLILALDALVVLGVIELFRLAL